MDKTEDAQNALELIERAIERIEELHPHADVVALLEDLKNDLEEAYDLLDLHYGESAGYGYNDELDFEREPSTEDMLENDEDI